jgi:hypothetical protein
MEEELQRIKWFCEEGDMERKVMKNMMKRLKKDKIILTQLKYNQELDLTLMKKQKQTMVSARNSKKEEEDKTYKVCRKMLEHVQEEERER